MDQGAAAGRMRAQAERHAATPGLDKECELVVRHLVPRALPSSIPAGPTQPADLPGRPVAAGEHRYTVRSRALLFRTRSARVVLGRLGVLRPPHRGGRVARIPVVALQADVDDLIAAHQCVGHGERGLAGRTHHAERQLIWVLGLNNHAS